MIQTALNVSRTHHSKHGCGVVYSSVMHAEIVCILLLRRLLLLLAHGLFYLSTAQHYFFDLRFVGVVVVTIATIAIIITSSIFRYIDNSVFVMPDEAFTVFIFICVTILARSGITFPMILILLQRVFRIK